MHRALPVVAGLCLLFSTSESRGHDAIPVTHEFGPFQKERLKEELRISVVDADTREPLNARLSFEVDGDYWAPEGVNEHGIRFTSIHKSKQQRFTVIYALITGPLRIPYPKGAESIKITASRGFEYISDSIEIDLEERSASAAIPIDRWSNLRDSGWAAIEEHLHYDRLNSADDRHWLAMLDADGLDAGHFMILKGGMVPGIWSRQFAFGEAGRSNDERQWLIPSQEYRASAKGHINLLGTSKIIEPYSTGGMGWPKVVENYPPLHDVLKEAQNQGGYAGVAHGGSLGKQPTAIADAVLGRVDFWEISNGFIYELDTWYRLMNCGYFLPPMAGTDLPNWPYRDAWQPFLGSIRTYVHKGGSTEFDAFKQAMNRGRVFTSSGPLIDLEINGQPIGESINLAEPGFVRVTGNLRSPRPLREIELIRNGQPVDVSVLKQNSSGIHTWSIDTNLKIEESSWIALSGLGSRINVQNIDATAHTNAIRVIVNDEPIRSPETAREFIEALQGRKNFYREKGAYKTEHQRLQALEIFDRAIRELEKRL
ncbi:MAG: hypothetical protein CMI15_08880 [Opitutaceae bacterium]|nr:hypothetical protein [Opitutaceae bacterium]